jgi:hypothetical protein
LPRLGAYAEAKVVRATMKPEARMRLRIFGLRPAGVR